MLTVCECGEAWARCLSFHYRYNVTSIDSITSWDACFHSDHGAWEWKSPRCQMFRSVLSMCLRLTQICTKWEGSPHNADSEGVVSLKHVILRLADKAPSIYSCADHKRSIDVWSVWGGQLQYHPSLNRQSYALL